MSSEPLSPWGRHFPPSFPFFLKYFLNTCYVPGTVLGSAIVNKADQTLPLQSSHSGEGDRQ